MHASNNALHCSTHQDTDTLTFSVPLNWRLSSRRVTIKLWRCFISNALSMCFRHKVEETMQKLNHTKQNLCMVKSCMVDITPHKVTSCLKCEVAFMQSDMDIRQHNAGLKFETLTDPIVQGSRANLSATAKSPSDVTGASCCWRRNVAILFWCGCAVGISILRPADLFAAELNLQIATCLNNLIQLLSQQLQFFEQI